MANYTKTTDFAVKDSLPSGDAGKVIRGSEFETEFDNISTAITTKADTISPTFTGTTVANNLTVNGNTIVGDAATDTVTVNADVASDLIPSADGTYDLGASGAEWQDLFIDGTANIDSLVLGSGSTVTSILDEDDLVSNSATALATQQSIKAYVDAQVTAQDLDIVGDTGSDAIDLDSETLTFTGGTGITSVVTAGTVTHNIDSTVATLTGTQTLTNKTLTSPDINGGTVDGAVIGGASAAAGTFTTVTADGIVINRSGVQSKGIAWNRAGTVDAAITLDETEWLHYDNYFNNGHRFRTGAAGAEVDHMTITPTGNVGIGAPAPSARLVVETASANDQAMARFNTSGGIRALINTDSDDDGAFSLYDKNDAVKVFLRSAGSSYLMGGGIGIGTTNPLVKTHIASDVSAGSITDSLLVSQNTASSISGQGTRVLLSSLNASNRAAGIAAIVGSSSNHDLAFYTNGNFAAPTEKMRIDSAGNVGIGTSNPQTELQVEKLDSSSLRVNRSQSQNQRIQLTQDTNGSTIEFGNNGAYGSLNLSHWNGTTSAIRQRFSPNGNVNFYNLVGGPTLSILNDGKVGIGTGSPVSALDVAGTVTMGSALISLSTNGLTRMHVQNNDAGAAAASQLYLESNGNNFFLTNYGDGTSTPNLTEFKSTAGGSAFAFSTANIERMRIDSSGNVGIGTSAPAANFQIGASSGGNRTFQMYSAGATRGVLSTDGANGIFSIGATNDSTTGILTFRTGSALTERMRINALGDVGIGTSSPASLVAGGNSPVLSIGGTNTALTTGDKSGSLSFITNDTSYTSVYSNGITGEIASVAESAVGGAYGLAFYTGTTSGSNRAERVRIDSSGEVGIGCLPESPLHISKPATGINAATTVLKLSSVDTSTAQYVGFQTQRDNAAGQGLNILVTSVGGTVSEAMRIDPSRNVLVGTTTVASGVGNTLDGISFLANGGSTFSRTGGVNPTMFVNRNGSDGDLTAFLKDGTSVGSIGSRVGQVLYIQSGQSYTGLDFSSSILPRKANALNDAGVDLGTGSYRFKDLYLSGGVYLGGTGSANHLDDYEEGTWTPTLEGSISGSATLTTNIRSYTKIGNTVRVDCYITSANVTGLSGNLRLGGLPFTGSGYVPVTIAYCSLFDFNEATDTVGGYIENGNSYINLTLGSSTTAITGTSADATDGSIMFTATYKTTA